MLYIIATPIGNLEDITMRALGILGEADVIYAEDTRRTLKLLSHYGIKKKLKSYQDKNKKKRTKEILDLLSQEKKVALVSDAGTPLVNDPGYYITREAIKEGYEVVPVPGPSAILAALIGSGLPPDKFSFLGYVPKKGKENFFCSLLTKEGTIILFESPHRLIKTLAAIKKILPTKKVVVARELTKKYEEFIRGSPEEVHDYMRLKKVKGEITLLLG